MPQLPAHLRLPPEEFPYGVVVERQSMEPAQQSPAPVAGAPLPPLDQSFHTTATTTAPAGVSQAQKQHEEEYHRVLGMMQAGTDERSQREMSTRDESREGTARMSSPPRGVYQKPDAHSASTSGQGDRFMQPFGIARQTHATEGQYTTLNPPFAKQRLETPLLPAKVNQLNFTQASAPSMPTNTSPS